MCFHASIAPATDLPDPKPPINPRYCAGLWWNSFCLGVGGYLGAVASRRLAAEDRGIAIRLPHNVRGHIKDDAHLGSVGLLAVLGENTLDRKHKADVASFLRPPVGLIDQHLPILPPRLLNGLREVGMLPLPAGKRPPVDPQSLADLPLRPKLSHKPQSLSLPLLLQLHEALGSLPLQLVLLLRGSFECLFPGHAITP